MSLYNCCQFQNIVHVRYYLEIVAVISFTARNCYSFIRTETHTTLSQICFLKYSDNCFSVLLASFVVLFILFWAYETHFWEEFHRLLSLLKEPLA